MFDGQRAHVKDALIMNTHRKLIDVALVSALVVCCGGEVDVPLGTVVVSPRRDFLV